MRVDAYAAKRTLKSIRGHISNSVSVAKDEIYIGAVFDKSRKDDGLEELIQDIFSDYFDRIFVNIVYQNKDRKHGRAKRKKKDSD